MNELFIKIGQLRLEIELLIDRFQKSSAYKIHKHPKTNI